MADDLNDIKVFAFVVQFDGVKVYFSTTTGNGNFTFTHTPLNLSST